MKGEVRLQARFSQVTRESFIKPGSGGATATRITGQRDYHSSI